LADLVRENEASLNELDFRAPDLSKVREPEAECKNGHNVSACIVQATGEAPPTACDHCLNGHRPFQICRVSRTIGKSACANCQWTGNANRCFWHQDKVVARAAAAEPITASPRKRSAAGLGKQQTKRVRAALGDAKHIARHHRYLKVAKPLLLTKDVPQLEELAEEAARVSEYFANRLDFYRQLEEMEGGHWTDSSRGEEEGAEE
ncbi:hypothetical protein KEM52_003418, partial [Ascosphaera acerosa]